MRRGCGVALALFVAVAAASTPAAARAPASVSGPTAVDAGARERVAPRLKPRLVRTAVRRLRGSRRFVASARALRRAPRNAPLPDRVPMPHGDDVAEPTPCTGVFTCAATGGESLLGRLRTPLVLPRFTIDDVGASDPQIAVGPQFILVSMRHRLALYDKRGRQVSLTRGGAPGWVTYCDFFTDAFVRNLNDNLRLPTHKTDADGNAISVANGYGVNCNQRTGGTYPPPRGWRYDAMRDHDGDGTLERDGKVEAFYHPDSFYDARVLWDRHRRRYWIGALAINNNTPYRHDDTEALGGVENEDAPGTRSLDVRRARRARFAIAVSRTSDPRDGWSQYWFPGFPAHTGNDGKPYPQEGSCPGNECPAEAQSDYPHMSVSRRYLLWWATGGWRLDPHAGFETSGLRMVATAIPADPLVSGRCLRGRCTAYQFNDWKNPNGKFVQERLFPVMAHDKLNDLGDGFFVHTSENPGAARAAERYQLIVHAIRHRPGKVPRVTELRHDVRPFFPAGLAPQADGTQFKIVHGTTHVNGATLVRGDLHATFDECREWGGEKPCRASIRYIRTGLRRDRLTRRPRIDRTFGARNRRDPAGRKAWYGFPTLEANLRGDAALVYTRSAADMLPEARYSVWRRTDPDVRPSRVLKAGESAVRASKPPDFLDASLDPNGRAIWLASSFPRDGGWRLAIGRVVP